MNEQWTYVGAATAGQTVALAVARPRWSLWREGRRPRGAWEPNLVSLVRRDRDDAVRWLAQAAGDVRTPLGESPRPVLLVDRSEVGGGDLLLRELERALERSRALRRVRMIRLDVTVRDVERSADVVARRTVLVPLLDALERDVLILPKGPIGDEFVDQYDALARKPDALGPREDLVRAVALCVWAIDGEGRVAAGGAGEPREGRLNVY